jgi:hypothetical protein
MTYTIIGAALKTKVEGVAGLAVSYNYEPKELEKYPAATIMAVGHSNGFSDLQANKRTFNFAIRVYYRTAEADTAESIVRSIVDSIISAVETDVTLGGTCDIAIPTSSTWGWGEREVPVRYCQINVSAQKRVAR